MHTAPVIREVMFVREGVTYAKEGGGAVGGHLLGEKGEKVSIVLCISGNCVCACVHVYVCVGAQEVCVVRLPECQSGLPVEAVRRDGH